MDSNTAVNAAGSNEPLTPEEVIRIVREMESRAPVVAVATSVSRNQQRRLQRVEQELIDVSLAAMNAAPEVQSALGRSDVDVRAEDADSTNWAVAIETVRQFANSLGIANQYRRQRVGLTALQAYSICRTLAREPRFAKTLAPHVDNMKHVLAKYRAKRQRTPEAPAPQQIAA